MIVITTLEKVSTIVHWAVFCLDILHIYSESEIKSYGYGLSVTLLCDLKVEAESRRAGVPLLLPRGHRDNCLLGPVTVTRWRNSALGPRAWAGQPPSWSRPPARPPPSAPP